MTAPRSVSQVNWTNLFGPPPPDLLFPHLWNTTSFLDQSTGLPGLRDTKYDVSGTLFPLPAHHNPTGRTVSTSPMLSDQLAVASSGRKSIQSNSGHQKELARSSCWSPVSASSRQVNAHVKHGSHDASRRITGSPSTDSEQSGRKRRCSPHRLSPIPSKYTFPPSAGRFAQTTPTDSEGRRGRRAELVGDTASPQKYWRVGQRYSDEPQLQKSTFMKNQESGSYKQSLKDVKLVDRVEGQGEEEDDEDDEDDDEEEEAENEGDEAELESKSGHSVECVVCGDKSSGKHYGQHTCEGCKSFFKRSVRRKLTYTCRGNRQCPIDIHHRNQCQYCRFQKCVKAGMRKEAVQQGRLPPFSTLYNPFFDHASFLGAVQAFNAPPGFGGPSFSAQFINMLLRAEPLSQRYSNATFAALKRMGSRWIPQSSAPHSQASTLTSSTSSCSAASSSSTSASSMSSPGDKATDLNLLTTDSASIRYPSTMLPEFSPMRTRVQSEMKKQADRPTGAHDLERDLPVRNLLTAIEWARSIPVFAELQLNDQLALLTNAWPELFLLNMVQTGFVFSSAEPGMDSVQPGGRTERHPSSSPVQPTTLVLDPKTSALNDCQDQLQNQFERLRLLQLDLPEFACLKSILLFNSEAIGLSDPITVECIQEKSQSALEEYERCQYMHHQPFRFGRLLLRLPRLKQVTGHDLQRLFFPHLDDRNSVDSFIREILLRGPPPPPPPPPTTTASTHPAPLNTCRTDLGMLNLELNQLTSPSLLSTSSSLFPTPRFESDINTCHTNLQCCEIIPNQFTHLLPHMRMFSEPANTSSNTVTTNLFNPFDPEWVWRNRTVPVPHPSVSSSSNSSSTMNGCPVPAGFTKPSLEREFEDEPRGSNRSAFQLPHRSRFADRLADSQPKVHEQSFVPAWELLMQNAANIVRTDSNNKPNGNNDALNLTEIVKHEPGQTNIVSVSSDGVRESFPLSPSHGTACPINSTPYSLPISNPATMQLYYAVMRHQLSLLQKQTSSILMNEKSGLTQTVSGAAKP